MSLLEQAQELSARLRRADAARSSIDEAHSLEEIRLKLSLNLERVRGYALRTSLLRANGVSITISPAVEAARLKVNDVADKFAQSPLSKTIRQGRRWTSLMEVLDSVSAALGQSLENDWKQYFSSALFGGAPPDQVRQRLPMTPQNEVALSRYGTLFRRFAAFRTRIPSTQSELDEVRTLSEDLEGIHFVEAVPDSVRAFFAATATGSGAGLDLLLPEVWEWMRDNGLLETYVVKAKFQGAKP